jgi:hypothetical protein
MGTLGYEAGACLPINHFEETARSGDSIGSVYGSYHCGMSINRIIVTSRM